MDRLLAPVPTGESSKFEETKEEKHKQYSSTSTGLQESGYEVIEKKSQVIDSAMVADEIIRECQKKKKEATGIIQKEEQLSELALKREDDIRRNIKHASDKERYEEKEVNRLMESERHYEEQRLKAHNEAVDHEQKRSEAAAARQAAELDLKIAVKEANKHKQAAEKAKALIGKFDMQIQEASLRKRILDYDQKNAGILKTDIKELERDETMDAEIVSVPREIPEQTLHSEKHGSPVVMHIKEKAIHASEVENVVEKESAFTSHVVEDKDTGKKKEVLEEQTLEETRTKLEKTL